MPVEVIEEQSNEKTILTDWSIRRFYLDDNVYIVVVGYDEELDVGLVSSPIKNISAKKNEVTSTYGHVYKLVGESGSHPDADYIWEEFASYYEISEDDWELIEIENLEAVTVH